MPTKAYRFRVHEIGTMEPTDETVDYELDTQLSAPPSIPGAIIDPIRGRTQSRPWSVQAIDVNDEIVSRLATPAGRMHQLGRLCDVQESTDSGDFQTLITGRLSNLNMANGPRLWDFQVEDERYVERNARVFTSADTSQIYPVGLRHRYRFFDAAPTVTMNVVEKWGNLVLLESLDMDPTTNPDDTGPIPQPVTELIVGDQKDVRSIKNDVEVGNFKTLRANLDGVDREIVSFSYVGSGSPEAPARPDVDVVWYIQSVRRLHYMWVVWPTGPEPSPGAEFEVFLHMPLREPDPALPLHIGNLNGSHLFGHAKGGLHPFDLVKRLYDLVGVRYDPVAMAALIADQRYPRVHFRITEAAKLAEWLEDKIFGPLLVTPFIDTLGRVALRPIHLPASVDPDTLHILTGTNQDTHPTFAHGRRELVNQIIFKVSDEYAVSKQDIEEDKNFSADGLTAKESKFERNHDNQATLGIHPITVDLTGWHVRGNAWDFIGDETPRSDREVVANYLAREVFDRFGDGPITGRISGLLSTNPIDPGELVVMSLATFPNPEDNAYGGDRILQILTKDLTPNGPEFEYVDVGPNLQPLNTPTLAIALNAERPEHDVDITVSNVEVGDGATAIIQLAYNATEPAADSDTWFVARTGVVNQLVTLRENPPGAKVWARARAVAPNRIRSGWSTPVSVTLDGTSYVRNLSIVFAPDGTPTVGWETNSGAAGVRVYAEVHDTLPPPIELDAEEDADADDGSVELGDVVVSPGQYLTVEVEPWSGFDGTAVTGTAGARSRLTLRLEGQTWGGTFDLVVDRVSGQAYLTPNAFAPDIRSWRAKISISTVAVDDFQPPLFNDADPNEIAGGPDTFGQRIAIPGAIVDSGEAIYLVGLFFDTPEVDDTSQSLARRSRPIRAWQPRDDAGPSANPMLDEDNGDLFLYPQRNALSGSVRYVVGTVEPTEDDVLSGAVTTSNVVEVWNFDPEGGEQTVYVGVIPFANADGTGAQGALRVRRYTFTVANDQPGISWMPIQGSDPDKEAVQLAITDDGDSVALFYRVYPEGTAAPAYTRQPASDFTADPLIHVVEATVPDEGDPPLLLEAYGVDDDGNASDRVLLRIDRGTVPSGQFTLLVDAANRVSFIPNTSDPDSGSWRARVTKTGFVNPTYTNANTSTVFESAGSTFGGEVVTDLYLQPGEDPYLSGFFYRVTDITGAAQTASRKSINYRVVIRTTNPESGQLSLVRVAKTLLYEDVRVDASPPINRIWVFDFIWNLAEGEPPAPPFDPALRTTILEPGNVYRVHRAPGGHARTVFFYAYSVDNVPLDAESWEIGPAVITVPSVDNINVVEGSGPNRVDISVTVSDAQNLGGHLRVWTAPTSEDDPVRTNPPDGVFEVASTPVTVGPSDMSELNEVYTHPVNGKLFFVEFVNSDGVSTGVQSHFTHGFSTAITFDDALRPAIVVNASIADDAIDGAQVRQRELDHLHLKVGTGVDRENIAAGAINEALTDFATLAGLTTDAGNILQGRFDNLPASTFINLNATGSQIVIGHPKFAVYANGNATFSGVLAAGTILTGMLVVSGNLADGAVDRSSVIVNGTITAIKMSVSELSEIAPDMGLVIHGELRNLAGTRYINLDATGTQSFIYAAGALNIRADGSATFGGTLDFATGNFSGALNGVTGTFVGVLTAGVSSDVPLSALNANIGTMTAGYIRNPADTAGLAIGNLGVNTGWSSYISFFTSDTYFLKGFANRFTVTHGGILTATDVHLTGAIFATSGSFHGTLTVGTTYGGSVTGLVPSGDAGQIIAGYIRNNDGPNGSAGLAIGNVGPHPDWLSYISFYQATGIDFIRGHSSRFRVDHSGFLTATGVHVTGHIAATSGSFAGDISAATGTFSGTVGAGAIIASGDMRAQHLDLNQGGDIILRPGTGYNIAVIGWEVGGINLASMGISAGDFYINSDNRMLLQTLAGDIELQAGGSVLEVRTGAPVAGATNIWLNVGGIGMLQIKRNASNNTLYVE